MCCVCGGKEKAAIRYGMQLLRFIIGLFILLRRELLQFRPELQQELLLR